MPVEEQNVTPTQRLNHIRPADEELCYCGYKPLQDEALPDTPYCQACVEKSIISYNILAKEHTHMVKALDSLNNIMIDAILGFKELTDNHDES